MQAIILAGGFGTRLKSLVSSVPKPMAPVDGRPFLSWLLEYMHGQGVRETVLCLHHLPELVQDYFGSRYGAMTLHYSIEKIPLGTGGAIRQALDMLAPSQPVFVLNGDSLVEVNYRRMMVQHQMMGRPLTLATRHVSDCSRYSELTVNGGLVTQYDLLGQAAPGQISTGFYVLSPELFSGYDLPQTFSIERDFFALHTPKLKPAVYNEVDYFIDIGVPHDYRRGQSEIPLRLTTALAA